MGSYNNKSKNKKKNISLGTVYIKATFNNTIVTITDTQGGAISASSSGAHGFKGAKKATPYAAQVTVGKAVEGARANGVKTVDIKITGPGSQRESALRAVCSSGLVVTTITDISPVPHNGVRPPNRRRV